jgi:hypothetical protein
MIFFVMIRLARMQEILGIIESVDYGSLLSRVSVVVQCHAKLMLLTMSLVCSALVCFIDTLVIYIDSRVFIILI